MPEDPQVLVEQANSEITRKVDQALETCDPGVIFSVGATAQKYYTEAQEMGLQVFQPEMKRIMELYSHASQAVRQCQLGQE